MSLFQNPEERFFEELIESTRRTLLNYARSHIRDATQAEDVVQETCLTAWSKIDALMDSQNPKGWLMNTLKNQLHKYHDKLASEQQMLAKLVAIPGDGIAYTDEPDGFVFASVLSEDELRIVRLREAGYKHDEIAKLMGIEPNAARKRLSRIKTKVTKFLEENEQQ
jgi:RNA polymerase sigma-70 factor (ECF subfamily)